MPFKPGDKVYCVDATYTRQLEEGKQYTVNKVSNSGNFLSLNETWPNDFFVSDRFTDFAGFVKFKLGKISELRNKLNEEKARFDGLFLNAQQALQNLLWDKFPTLKEVAVHLSKDVESGSLYARNIYCLFDGSKEYIFNEEIANIIECIPIDVIGDCEGRFVLKRE